MTCRDLLWLQVHYKVVEWEGRAYHYAKEYLRQVCLCVCACNCVGAYRGFRISVAVQAVCVHALYAYMHRVEYVDRLFARVCVLSF